MQRVSLSPWANYCIQYRALTIQCLQHGTGTKSLSKYHLISRSYDNSDGRRCTRLIKLCFVRIRLPSYFVRLFHGVSTWVPSPLNALRLQIPKMLANCMSSMPYQPVLKSNWEIYFSISIIEMNYLADGPKDRIAECSLSEPSVIQMDWNHEIALITHVTV